MNKELKIHVVGGNSGYVNWIPNVRLVQNLADADVVWFTGGEDVTPSFYKQKANKKTFSNWSRDTYESTVYKAAREMNKFCVGTCRGSQLLCALQPAGKLVQHQHNPGNHQMTTYDGKTLLVTSTHHQAQFPFNMEEDEYKVLGWTKGISKFHQGVDEEDELNPPVECEIVYYPKTKCLGIQSHPEMMIYHHETNEWMRDLLNKFLNNEL